MNRSPLLGCDGISKAYGGRALFRELSFALFPGDRAALVGPNGSGKSTLLRILAGIEPPDGGTRAIRRGLRVGYVAQDPVFASGLTVEAALGAALVGADPDALPGRIAEALGRAGLDNPDAAVDTLSGGWRKRLAIAQALAAEPDVLLMDEPTNHLDLDGILWLEAVLAADARAFVVVSHDRYFLEHVASRVLELNRVYRTGMFESTGRYSEFLARRDDHLRGQAAYEESLANTVRREIAWLRQGAKARSTKAKGRIEAAGRMVEELAEARDRTSASGAGIELSASARRTRTLLVASGVTKSRGGRTIVRGLDLTISRGARLGLIGPNGSGKTTVLDLLAGALAPDAGRVEHADGLRLVRFEQDRAGLDPRQSLRRALAPDGDLVAVQGRSIHVAAWGRRFLFGPEQLELPVGRLSGGEQARVLIARLAREPADLLMLDEPTNDLDIDTLEVLEQSLVEFAGAIVLVTHDRFMLERVCTAIVALDGHGSAEAFADYAQWESTRAASTPAPRTAAGPPRERVRPRTRRLGYLEQREWDGMEQAILDAEAAVERCRDAAEDPAIASDAAALAERYAALEAARAAVNELYARWAELERKQA